MELSGESAPAPHLGAARQVVPLRALPIDGSAPGGATAAAGAVPGALGAAPAVDEGSTVITAARAVSPAESAPYQRASEAADAAGGADAAPVAGQRELIKGELIYPGTRRLLSRFNHLGISMGPDIIENDYFLTIDPGVTWYLSNGLSFSMHVPLRLLAWGAGTRELGSLRVRAEDWRTPADFAKVIRFLTYGRKEANLYFTINTMRPATIGHGMLVNRYQGDIDVNRSLTGAMLDAYNRYGGFELQANDITFGNRILGGLAFIKPLSLLSRSPYAEGVSLGFEGATDLSAPRCVLMAKGASDCVHGTGHAAGFDPYTGASLDHSFVRTDPDTGRFAVKEATVSAVGISAESKIYRDASTADVKLYGTWHRFTNSGGGDGYSGGVLARLSFGDEWVSAMRLRAEYRGFGDGYIPSYFDSLYELQKYSHPSHNRAFQVTPTKYQAVFGDPQNGFARPSYGWRNGYNLEGSWGLFHKRRSAKKLAIGFGLADATGPDDTSFYAHVEAPVLGFLQLFATYFGENLANVDEVFRASALDTWQDAVLLTGVRLQVLPILFINAHYSRSYSTVASAGSEYHLGNANIVDESGQPSSYFRTDHLFENVQTLFVQVEWGWEFDHE